MKNGLISFKHWYIAVAKARIQQRFSELSQLTAAQNFAKLSFNKNRSALSCTLFIFLINFINYTYTVPYKMTAI